MNDKEWAEFKEKFSNGLTHKAGRIPLSEGGSPNGETKDPDHYDPVGEKRKGVLDADGKYHYDTGGPATGAIAGAQAAAGKLTPEEAQAQANEQTAANDQNRVDSLKNQIANVAASIASSMDKAKNATSYAAKETAQKAVESGQSLLDRLKNTLSTIGSNLKSTATTVTNKVKAANEESKRKTDETKQKISDAFKKAVDTTKRGLDIGDAIRENKEDEARRENAFREDDYIQSIIRKQADEKYGDTNITDDDNIFKKLSKKIRGSLKDNYIEKQQYDESGLDRLFKSDERRAQDYNDYIQNLVGFDRYANMDPEEREYAKSEDSTLAALEKYINPEQQSYQHIQDKLDAEARAEAAFRQRLADNAAKGAAKREAREQALRDQDIDSSIAKFLGQDTQREDEIAKRMEQEDRERALLEEYYDMDPDEREAAESSGAVDPYILELIRKYGVRHSALGFELQHHGIKGQRWGDRSGPPYPLSRLNKQSYLEKGAALVDKAYGSLSVNQLISQQKAEGHVPSQKGLPNNQNQQKPKGDTRKPDITPEAHRNNKPQQQNNQNNRPNNQQNNQKSNGASVADYISLGSELLTTSNKLVQDDIKKNATVKMDDPQYVKMKKEYLERELNDWLNDPKKNKSGLNYVPDDVKLDYATRANEMIKKNIRSRSIDGKTAYDYGKVNPTEQKIGNVLGLVSTVAATGASIATLIERLKRAKG